MIVVDLFAGGGGASRGIEAALGRSPDIAINHDPVAIAVHQANHPKTRHFQTSVWDVDPLTATRGQPVFALWASPDCKHFSRAKGDVPKSKGIRSLAWVVARWAKAVRPQIIFLENVEEFKGWGPLCRKTNKPIKSRAGQTFRGFVRRLESLGYVVDYRVLDASRFGAPTKRKRLFMVARCDGAAISWPEPTHGPGLLPLRTAADCIDWSLPCPSIFERKRPLAEKTLWRIAQGIRRFVVDSPNPFIVKVNHGKPDARVESIRSPLSTVTAQRRGHALVSPTLIQTGYGERPGQRARVPGLAKPLGTCVDGQKHALVAAFISRYFNGKNPVVGKECGAPLPTVTAWDHNALAAVTLAKFRGTQPNQPGSASLREPLPVVSAGGIHVAEVVAFLTAYYGNDATCGQQLSLPLRTVTTKPRLGLVTIAGVDYQIVDIGMRMLEPHELLAAQFGRFATDYDLSPAKTKEAQVRLIGNSVCPEVAEAIVAANCAQAQSEAAA